MGTARDRTTDGLRRRLHRDLYLDKPSEIERYDGAFKKIVNAALDDTESRTLSSKKQGSYCK
jgi:hypothetical protein